ncbi:hypothetical protein QTP88_023749 [Uroleucon formosanum]
MKLPWDTYNRYFRIIKLIDEQMSYFKYHVKCMHCVGPKTCADTRSTSNLRKHLASQHKSVLDEITKKTSRESLLKKSYPTTLKRNSNKVTQSHLDTMIQKLIINQCLPFSLVESDDFKLLVQEGYPTLKVISLENYITTSADCWSIFKRSYIGITVSCLLAIKRLEGKHTYDVLAKTMEAVYTEFEINNKISHTTADNGSNFVKSFNVYSKKDYKDYITTEFNLNTFDGEVDDISEGVAILPIIDVLLLGENNTENNEFENLYSLPKHHRCAAHTLNLVATKDFETALLCYQYKKQSRSTFAKINDIFNNMKFLLNCLRSSISKCNTVCDEIKVSRIKKSDSDFIEEYCTAMEPLAISLDILLGEHNMYFGYLLSTITELMSKFEKLKNSRMNYCQPLIIALHEGVNKIFGELLNDEFLIISATSHPFFKTAWIDNEFKKNSAVTLLRDAVMLDHENKSLGVNSPISEHDVDSDSDDNANTSLFSWTQKKNRKTLLSKRN